MFTSFGQMEVIVTGISEQFSRGLTFGKVKVFQYLTESFSATSPGSIAIANAGWSSRSSRLTAPFMTRLRHMSNSFIAEPWFDAKPDMANACANSANTGVVDGNRGELRFKFGGVNGQRSQQRLLVDQKRRNRTKTRGRLPRRQYQTSQNYGGFYR